MPVHKEMDHLGLILPASHSPRCLLCVRLMCCGLQACGRIMLFIDSRAHLLPQHITICEELLMSCTEEGCCVLEKDHTHTHQHTYVVLLYIYLISVWFSELQSWLCRVLQISSIAYLLQFSVEPLKQHFTQIHFRSSRRSNIHFVLCLVCVCVLHFCIFAHQTLLPLATTSREPHWRFWGIPWADGESNPSGVFWACCKVSFQSVCLKASMGRQTEGVIIRCQDIFEGSVNKLYFQQGVAAQCQDLHAHSTLVFPT